MADHSSTSVPFITKRFEFESNLNNLLVNADYVKPSTIQCHKCKLKNRICVCQTIDSEIGSTDGYVIDELLECKKNLNELRNCLDEIDISQWSRHTNLHDNTSLIHHTLAQTAKGEAFELLTNAWIKFYEILFQCNLLDLCNPPVSNIVSSFHIAECPGSFISALNHYLHTIKGGAKLRWKATSLNPYFEGNNHNVILKEDILFRDTYYHWIKGLDDSGDITIKENLEYIWSSTRPNKYSKELFLADIVTADGSFNCQHAPNQQEILTAKLIYSELVCALGMLRVGGVLLLKMFTLFEHTSLSIFVILSICFKRLQVVKPVLSKDSSAEIYVLGICFNGIGSALLSKLCNVIGKLGNNALIPSKWIPHEFRSEYIMCAKYFSEFQTRWLRQTISLFNQPNDENNLYKLKREFAKKFIEKNKILPLPITSRLVPSPTFMNGLITGAETSSIGHMDCRWYSTLQDRINHYVKYTNLQRYMQNNKNSTLAIVEVTWSETCNKRNRSDISNYGSNKFEYFTVLEGKNAVIDKLLQSLTLQLYLKENWFAPVKSLDTNGYKMSYFVDNDLMYDCIDINSKICGEINPITFADCVEIYCASGEMLSDPAALPSSTAVDLSLILQKFGTAGEFLHGRYPKYAEITNDTTQKFAATCLLKRHSCSGHIIYTRNNSFNLPEKETNFHFESATDLMQALDSFVGSGKIISSKIVDLLALYNEGKTYKHLVEMSLSDATKRSYNFVYIDPVAGLPYFKDPFGAEVNSKIILTGQLVLGINLIADGGDLVIHLSTTLTRYTVCLILALRCVFDNVNLFRPSSVPNWSKRNYLICRKFNDKDNCVFRHYIQCLWDANSLHNQSKLAVLQPLLPIYFSAPDFVRPLYEYNTMLLRLELEDLKLRLQSNGNGSGTNECSGGSENVASFICEYLKDYLYPGDLAKYSITPTKNLDPNMEQEVDIESPLISSPEPSPTLLSEIWCDGNSA
ncbi:Cap-specific mRNA (nucleoside-2'-O-)-methyltransferase 2 [Babesia microti strain RI]|uniref:Cap-specific mRNA (nucleoside-2'-O-)-methyltransferase 2 n=1 Tax=Babesia microti (strain RI) TaxID=1133968 RepID=A0A1R4AAB2_BABMR|nr:Cap-specific mRNA (nucleoside-2'-O-)-methyltransferase 2 [Babesia microti strain RI]SJK85942.1 Cap-specific mRNA (nucleoside-2'-O-)-methyltransferase 2 [Babesia microti strain RI]|eukprot:XP_021338148.1 Cap-specific mRNA (nucleoside-2'-O-)-methyltransferase 2 [Babesia microti strain RI]